MIMAERVPDKLGRWVLLWVPSSIPRGKFDLTGKWIVIPPFPACAFVVFADAIQDNLRVTGSQSS